MSDLIRPNTWLIVEAVICFFATDWGIRVFLRWSAGRLLDVPNARSLHVRPTPRGAGVVIVIVIGLTLSFAAALAVPISLPWSALAAAMLIAIAGGVDDVRPLPTTLRLLIQLASATVAIASIRVLPSVDAAPWAAAALAVVWVAGLTNAYNFMDGIDGIAGSQAVVAGVTIAALGGHAGSRAETVAGVAIAASNAGFLLHNWSPARVFMGDVGSAFLGFFLATLTLTISARSATAGVVVIASLWPFVFDTSFTLVRRVIRRENVLMAHRSHLYQRLVIAGWSHAQVTVLYASMALAGAVVAFTWSAEWSAAWILLVIPIIATTLWALVVRRESIAAAASRNGRRGVSVRG